jgi:enamine deaminase RidA (YjgF/YER057c/UK114 family)
LWGYSRALRVGDRIEVSGTTAVSADGEVVAAGDPYAQTRFIFGIIATALAELGASLDDVVRTRVFLRDIVHWREVGRAHRELFGSVKPTSSCVGGVDLLNPALLVEIEAVAAVRADATSTDV